MPQPIIFGDEIRMGDEALTRAEEAHARLESGGHSDAEFTRIMNEVNRHLQAAEMHNTRANVQLRIDERGDMESAELGAIRDGANVGRIFEAIIDQREVDGREAELQRAAGIAPNQVPLSLIATRALTAAPANTGASQGEIVQPVFATGDAAYLGVPMPTVGAGESVYPILTSRPSVGGPHTDSTAVGETDGTFSADALQPSRLQANFRYRRTEAARFAGMDAALRAALGSGLSEAMDAQVIARIVTDVTRTNATAVDTFATYRKRLVYDRLDGRYATVEGDLRMVVGSATAAHMSSVYRSNNADDSALDSIRRVSGGVRVSAHVAAVASSKQDAIIRRGGRMDAVAPVWEGVTLIPDQITKAAEGEIRVTAVMLAAFKITRTDGFARIETQHA